MSHRPFTFLAAVLLVVDLSACLYGSAIEDELRGRRCGAAGICPGGFVCVDGACETAPAGTSCDPRDFAASLTRCGLGPCVSDGLTACVRGRVQDSCRALAPPVSVDVTCDGADDDCDGLVDDDAGTQRAVELAAGSDHTCARLDDGSVWCWGRSDFGQLGLGTTGDVEVPTRVPLFGPVRSIAAGAVNTCAVFEDGRMQCWGAHRDFQLG